MGGKGKRGALALCVLALALCAGMTAFYLIAGYGAYLDADMASELTMSQHLLRARALVSGSWYHSTELRLLDTQLVYTPLMALFPDNWRLVRTVGDLILVALLGAASCWCARSLGAKGRFALLAAALTVSVNSPLYAQFVIIGTRYVPHAMFVMLTAGLYARWLQSRKIRYPALMAALLFAVCASSMRYLLSAVLPLSCAALWRFTFPDEGEHLPRTRGQRADLAAALAAAAAGGAGYAFSRAVLSKRLLSGALDYYGGTAYADWTQSDLFAKLQEALRGLLGVLGFEGGTRLFGAQGILNALVLLTLFAGALLLLRALRRDGPARFGALMLTLSGALSLAAFVLLSSLYFDRYWLSVTALGVPVLMACLSAEENGVLRRLAALLLTGTVLLTSASCMYYSMKNPQVDGEMRAVAVQALRERGLTKGYATFWNANIVTELSDGEIDVAAVEKVQLQDGTTSLAPYKWLEAEEDFALDRPQEPVFLLLGVWEGDGMDAFLARADAEYVPLDGYVDLYVIPSQALLFEAMGAPGGA